MADNEAGVAGMPRGSMLRVTGCEDGEYSAAAAAGG